MCVSGKRKSHKGRKQNILENMDGSQYSEMTTSSIPGSDLSPSPIELEKMSMTVNITSTSMVANTLQLTELTETCDGGEDGDEEFGEMTEIDTDFITGYVKYIFLPTVIGRKCFHMCLSVHNLPLGYSFHSSSAWSICILLECFQVCNVIPFSSIFCFTHKLVTK